MQRIYTNEVVMLIAGLLLVAALIFAWQRSSQPAETADPVRADSTVSRDGDTFGWQTLGLQTYQARCASCHGQGQAGSRVPPLRGHAVDLFEAGQGRAYLVSFLLHGRAGPIEVGGRTYRPGHPTYDDRLSDEQIAAVLNHVLTAWDDEAGRAQRLYVPEDIARQRQNPMTPEQVRALRPGLLDK